MEIDPLLKEEYFHIQKEIEGYDQKSLSVKSWSVTVGVAGIASAFHQGVPALLLVAAVASLLFWIIEVYWKVFQNSFYPRVRRIEKYFRTGKGTIAPLQMTRSWYGAFEKIKADRSYLKLAFYPHIFLPHLLVVIGGVVTWVANHYLMFIALKK